MKSLKHVYKHRKVVIFVVQLLRRSSLLLVQLLLILIGTDSCRMVAVVRTNLLPHTLIFADKFHIFYAQFFNHCKKATFFCLHESTVFALGKVGMIFQHATLLFQDSNFALALFFRFMIFNFIVKYLV